MVQKRSKSYEGLLTYDPARVMPNGEMVWQARSRLLKCGTPELKMQAMALVQSLVRGGMKAEEAEDKVYTDMFGLAKFSVKSEPGKGSLPSLEEVVRGDVS